MNKPMSVMFFPNGTVAVCDERGEQMPEFQHGCHKCTIERLEAAEYSLSDMQEVLGVPHRMHADWCKGPDQGRNNDQG